jgi:predicted RNA-binding protein YlxR (DUF448 family)
MKSVPFRRCCATGESYPKDELFRVVRSPEGIVSLDLSGKANGRGAYVLKDEAVIVKAKQSKVLDRALETEVPEAIYDRMILFLRMK